MDFLELRQARGVYFRVATGMPILNGSLMDFRGGSDGKESACNVADLGSIPGSGSKGDDA